MGVIFITNNSTEDIYVSVTATGGDFGGGGSESWYTVKANGGADRWSRSEWQVIRFTRSKTAGVLVETILGVPDKAVTIS